MTQIKCCCSWSGGKDSCYALMQAIDLGYQPQVLLNVLNEEGEISRSHGIPSYILKRQGRLAGLPVHLISSSWKDYEQNFTTALDQLQGGYELTHAIFGDIDLQPHRDWEEMVCRNAGLTAVLPLWKKDRKALVLEMLEAGIEAIIVSCNETMGPQFLGKRITAELIGDLDELGIDPCGENGEYHTLVTSCPLFRGQVRASVREKVQHENYWFALLREDEEAMRLLPE